MITRDLAMLCIISGYIFRVAFNPQTMKELTTLQLSGEETTIQLQFCEFEDVILSVLPYQYFKEFVAERRPKYLPYLRVLTLY